MTRKEGKGKKRKKKKRKEWMEKERKEGKGMKGNRKNGPIFFKPIGMKNMGFGIEMVRVDKILNKAV